MIPLFKVWMADDAAARVADVLASGYIGQGPQCEALEAALAPVLGTPEPPLLLNSCTSAIDLALHLIGVGPGDEVITTPMTCTATNSPIVTRGARPVWADVDPATGLIDPADAFRKITSRTKAILGVDWGGAPCDYDTLRTPGIPVIQDAAHGPSGGTRGTYVCWSFQAIKHLTTGDGGALWCPPEQLERARLLRWYGLDRRSKSDFRCEQRIVEVGYKYQSNDIAAAIGLANLPGLAARIRAARTNAYAYHLAFAGQPHVRETPWCDASSYWLYTLLVPADRQGFIAHLADRGIAASPVHARNDIHPAFRFPSGPLPGVDTFAASNVAIPVGHWLTAADVDCIIQAVLEWTP